MYLRHWFTSDYHIGHENVLKLCNRPFQTILEHDIAIRDNHNSLVNDNDIVWNFGDVGFRCSPQHIASFIRSLKGQQNVILGNHDKPLRQAIHLNLLNDLLNNGKLKIIGGNESINDSDLAIAKRIKINDQKIFISHYAQRTWPAAFGGCWMLYGHSHNNLKNFFKSMDVGVDTETILHNKFYPWSFEEIKAIMDSVTDEFTENPSTIPRVRTEDDDYKNKD